MLVGDFNVEPTKIPCLAKGILAGLWVDFEASWALATGLQPAPTCKLDWSASSGHRRDFMVGCPLAAAAVLSSGGLLLILLLGLSLTAVGGPLASLFLSIVGAMPGLLSLFVALPFGLLLGCHPVDKSRGSKSVEVQRVWEIYDERLQLMSRHDAVQLGESLGADDVSRAWLVWSGAAEAAFADAFRFGGGPLPSRGLVLGRGSASFQVVRLWWSSGTQGSC